MEKRIDGKVLSDKIKDEIELKVLEINEKFNKVPCLAVVIIGNDPASEIYVKNKEKACKKCGIASLKYELDINTSEDDLITLIEKLNNDDNVNGILIQLPLPEQINYKKIIKIISPEKDVDCFSAYNTGNLFNGDFDFNKSILPCTPKGCIKLIKSVLGNNLNGKKVCILGRSNIVGKPVFQLLLNENCTIKMLHSKSENIKDECLWADIIVAAIGKPKFVTADMVKNGVVIIDVGINRSESGICGDVDFDGVLDKAKYITPVPGGVGPMTIACLMENVFNAFLKQNNF